MLVHQFLVESAQRTPDAVALIEPHRAISYGALDSLSNRVANALHDRGVRRHDRVVIALDNSIEQVASYFGAQKAGAVPVPLPAGPRSDRLDAAVLDCAPAACVIDARTARRLPGDSPVARVPRLFECGTGPASTEARHHGEPFRLAVESASPETPPVRLVDLDLASIIYTSGSTGEPRGVMLTHRNVVANTRSIVSYLELTARDRVMCVLPFYYVYGLSLLHTHTSVGGSIVLENRFAFPNVVVAAMQEHHVTGFAGVPSTFTLLLHRSIIDQVNIESLRYVTQAGGSLPPARLLEWLARGPGVPFFVMYGATEASARLTYLPPRDLRRKLGSIGKPIPNVEITVLTESGETAADGEVGELVARGTNIALGYWNNPEETGQRFGPHGFRTGDLGYRDAEGFLYLVGRRHDMIKVGAHRVGAKEIEDVLNEHEAVLEAAVVGVPHDVLGEAPVAFVSLRNRGTLPAEELQAFCRERLAPHKMPQRVLFRAELPKSGVGKVDRLALRQAALSNGGGG